MSENAEITIRELCIPQYRYIFIYTLINMMTVNIYIYIMHVKLVFDISYGILTPAYIFFISLLSSKILSPLLRIW